MGEYRIVTDGKIYKIQKKHWLWRYWFFVEKLAAWGERIPISFATLTEAQARLTDLNKPKYKPVWVPAPIPVLKQKDREDE